MIHSGMDHTKINSVTCLPFHAEIAPIHEKGRDHRLSFPSTFAGFQLMFVSLDR